MSNRHYTAADRFLIDLQRGIGQLLDDRHSGRGRAESPVAPDVSALTEADRRHAAGLMRVNHAGEIAAQALYHGQALTARNPNVREHMREAAAEEQDHLDWCAQRVAELGEDTSRLGPLWYAGSFAMGAIAGLAGDRTSLGFVAETEKQVVEHLEAHLDALPADDQTSREIVARMRDDEARHGDDAREAGGGELPGPVKRAMKLVSRIMTRTAYWV